MPRSATSEAGRRRRWARSAKAMDSRSSSFRHSPSMAARSARRTSAQPSRRATSRRRSGCSGGPTPSSAPRKPPDESRLRCRSRCRPPAGTRRRAARWSSEMGPSTWSTLGRDPPGSSFDDERGTRDGKDDMTAAHWHLAQLNVGRMLAPVTAPEIADFMAALDPINALADEAAGFVWRLQTGEGNATSIHAFDDELMLLNMSVWESIESLRAFAYTTGHTDVLRRRREWFERLAVAHLVLWWVPAGHIPSIAEALDRLELLRRDGPTPAAFTFRVPFEPDRVDPGDALVGAEFCWAEPAEEPLFAR